jgi:hypothetical protein
VRRTRTVHEPIEVPTRAPRTIENARGKSIADEFASRDALLGEL